jgi:hypothetical protein
MQVCVLPECEDWNLYLVDWGYNTSWERERAAANPRIEVLGFDSFIARTKNQ